MSHHKTSNSSEQTETNALRHTRRRGGRSRRPSHDSEHPDDADRRGFTQGGYGQRPDRGESDGGMCPADM
jgi:hypothetical protein